MFVFFFFFKQKTAYEMRISDWSSDLCSSDLAGFVVATVMYLLKPDLPAKVARVLALPIRVLNNKYGMDDLWIKGLAGGSVLMGRLSRRNDDKAIDGAVAKGSARLVDLSSGVPWRTTTGLVYHYASVMILGLIVFPDAHIRYWRST